MLENTEGLSQFEALRILKRVMSFADLFILANTSSFTELEQDKNMPSGGIIRQCLRLSKTNPFLRIRPSRNQALFFSDDGSCSPLYGMSLSTIRAFRSAETGVHSG